MDEQSLGDLVLRLVGDATSYLEMLTKAKDETEKATNSVETTVEKLTKCFKNQVETYGMTSAQIEIYKLKTQGATEAQIKQVESAQKQVKVLDDTAKKAKEVSDAMAGLSGKVMGGLGMLGIGGSLKGALDKFADYEKTQLKLTAAIESGGHSAASVVPQYEAFAASLSKQSVAGKGAIMALLQYTETLGLSGKAAEEVTKQALGMAATMGGSAQHWVMMAKAVKEGNAAMIHHVPALRGIRNEQDKLAKAAELLAGAEAGMKAEAESFSGQMTMMGRSLGGVTMEMGRMLASALKPMIGAVRSLADAFNSLGPTTKTVAATILGLSIGIVPLVAAFNAFLPTIKAVGLAIAAAGKSVGLFSTALLANPITIWTAGLVAAAVAIYRIADAITGASDAQEELNKQVEAHSKLTEETSKERTKFTLETARDIQTGFGSGTTNVAGSKEFLKDRKAEVDEQKKQFKDQIAELEGKKKETTWWKLGNFDEAKTNNKIVQFQIDLIKNSLKNATDQSGALSDALKKLELPAKLQQELDNTVKKLKDHKETLGFSSSQKTIHDIQQKFMKERGYGMTKEEQAPLIDMSMDNALADIQFKFEEKVKNANRAVEEQAETLGMSDDAAKLYKERMEELHKVEEAIKPMKKEQADAYIKNAFDKAAETGKKAAAAHQTEMKSIEKTAQEMKDKGKGKEAAKYREDALKEAWNKYLDIVKAANDSIEAARIEAAGMSPAERAKHMKAAEERVKIQQDAQAKVMVEKFEQTRKFKNDESLDSQKDKLLGMGLEGTDAMVWKHAMESRKATEKEMLLLQGAARKAFVDRMNEEEDYYERNARSIGKYQDAMKRHVDFMHKGKGLTHQFLSPEAKLTEHKDELREMFDNGAISAETYSRAVAKAVEETKDLNAQHRDAALVGSKEDKHRLEEYAKKIRGNIAGAAAFEEAEAGGLTGKGFTAKQFDPTKLSPRAKAELEEKNRQSDILKGIQKILEKRLGDEADFEEFWRIQIGKTTPDDF